jgi:putative chitinase
LNKCFVDADINTVQRCASLLGQLLLECGEFRYKEEMADGSAYEGRKDLGNTSKGDGKRYKGRGWIQLTGRANYEKASRDLVVDLVDHPELACTPEMCGRIVTWYWNVNGMNALADSGNQRRVTRVVNGASTDGPPSYYLRRLEYYERALAVLQSVG